MNGVEFFNFFTTKDLLIYGMFLFLLILLSICLSYLLFNKVSKYQPKHAQKKPYKPQPERDEIMALDLNVTEFYKALNFMLMYGVITFEQYTEIELKSLPYLTQK